MIPMEHPLKSEVFLVTRTRLFTAADAAMRKFGGQIITLLLSKICKFRVEPVALAKNHGFSSKELNTIYRIIRLESNIIKRYWDEHCCQ
jgi:hypothetical protein